MNKTVRVAAIFLILSSATVTFAAKKPKPQQTQQPASVRLDDQTVNTDLGSFAFNDLIVSQDSIFLRLNGSMTNLNTHTWEFAAFEVIFLNANGEKTATAILSYKRLNPGETRKIEEPPGASLNFTKGNASGGFKIVYLWGSVETFFRVKLIKPIESDILSFDDANILINFDPGKTSVGFVLRNLTDDPIQIDWDQVSFIDSMGKPLVRPVRLEKV